MFCVAESIVKRGQFNVNPMWWMGPSKRNPGLDGELYSKYGLGQSLSALPLYWIAVRVPGIGNVQTVMLFNAFVTALTAVIVFLYVIHLGGSPSVALVAALVFGLCTPAGVYAKYFFSEPLVALGLLLTAYLLTHYREGRGALYALGAGGALGLALLTKMANAVTIPIFAAYGFWPHPWSQSGGLEGSPANRSSSPDIKKHRCGILLFSVPIALSLLITGTYNYMRFGNILKTGYQNISFSTPLWRGIYGLLFSPGKGLFIYAPILLVLLPSIPLFFKQRRAETVLVGALFIVYCLLFGTWYSWRGGISNWGPRLMVPAIPFLIIALTPALEFVSKKGSLPLSLGFVLLCALSAAIQALGASVSPILYESVLEKLFSNWADLLVYDPQYSPLVGYLPLVRPENLDLAWVQADSEGFAIDGFVLFPTLVLILIFGAGLLYLRRHGADRKGLTALIACCLILPLTISSFSLRRYYDDPHYSGTAGYRALLACLQDHSRPDDVLILTDASYTDFFLNHNKAPLNWYSLDKGESPWGGEAADLLKLLLSRYHRIWLITEPIPVFGWPSGTDRWLAQRAYKVEEMEFGPQARLVLYSTSHAPHPEKPQQVTNLIFGDTIQLLGYDLHAGSESSPLHRGDIFQISFLWQAIAPVPENYMIFVHLLDNEGHMLVQEDRPGVDGYRPTQSWRPEEKIRDNYWLELPADIPAGEYHLIAGMYRLETLEHLPISKKGDGFIGDHISLGSIVVSP